MPKGSPSLQPASLSSTWPPVCGAVALRPPPLGGHAGAGVREGVGGEAGGWGLGREPCRLLRKAPQESSGD